VLKRLEFVRMSSICNFDVVNFLNEPTMLCCKFVTGFDYMFSYLHSKTEIGWKEMVK
jgi:hypothetical protein